MPAEHFWGCGVGLALVALLQALKPEVRDFLTFEAPPDAATLVDAQPELGV